MYWIYLIIFVLAVLTPEAINHGVSFLGEEDVESLLVFCFGAFGFAIYLIKEKALVRVFKEKLHLQKQANIITRDLSDSYSYIGEMNRKLDIVKDLIFRLPNDTAEVMKGEDRRDTGIYRSVLETVLLLSRADAVSIRFVNLKTKTLEKKVGNGDQKYFSFFEEKPVLQSKKIFSEKNNCVIVRSPQQACGVVALIIFPKTSNHIEDVEVFKMVASEALFLYCVERGMMVEPRSHKEKEI